MKLKGIYRDRKGAVILVLDTGDNVQVCTLRPMFIIGADCTTPYVLVDKWLSDIGATEEKLYHD